MNLYNDKFPVYYGQFYLLSEEGVGSDLSECFLGQKNGLCGTVSSGMVFCITGLHTGKIGLQIDLEEYEPDLDRDAGEIVEASFSVTEAGIDLESWGGEVKECLPIPSGHYRIRYSAYDFAKAEETGEFDAGDIETYKIQVWPSDKIGDSVIKVSTEQAGYWHSEVKRSSNA